MKNITEEFKNYKLIHNFINDEPLKAWLNEGNFNNIYKEDWNALMEVVDKIESIIFDDNNSFNVTIGSTIYCVIQDSNGECYDMTYDGEKTKLLVVYKAVVEFIKWHNNQKDYEENNVHTFDR